MAESKENERCYLCRSEKVEWYQPLTFKDGTEDMAPMCDQCYKAFQYGWSMCMIFNNIGDHRGTLRGDGQ